MAEYDNDTAQLLGQLSTERLIESRAVARYSFAMIGALVVALIASGPLSNAAFVLAALFAMIVNMSLMARTRLEGQIFVIANLDRFRSEVSGADWLAYHLAQRIREEQEAIAAADAAEAAAGALAAAEDA